MLRISAPPSNKRPPRISAHPIYVVFETFLVKKNITIIIVMVEHEYHLVQITYYPSKGLGIKDQKSKCCGCKEISAPSNKRPLRISAPPPPPP